MKRPANITLLCGAAAVILSCIIMLNLLKKETTMEILTGTYGEQIYRYSFDTESLEFSLIEKIKAENASTVTSLFSEIISPTFLTTSIKA